MKFDEYGIPVINPEDAEKRACLSAPIRPANYCPFQSGNTQDVFAQRMALEKVSACFADMCFRCWQRVDGPGRNSLIPEGLQEVGIYHQGWSIGRYAVPMKAIRSLETLWEEQSNQRFSDCDHEHLYRTAPAYLGWANSKNNHPTILYPWKWMREKEGWVPKTEP